MNKCYHCGDNCEEEIQFEDKTFCCSGCKMVFSILSGSELGSYYQFETATPGMKSNIDFQGKYNFLDLPEFIEKLLVFHEGDMAKIKLFLPQIHCSSCLWLLERLDKLSNGVHSSQVHFVKKEVDIIFDISVISLKKLIALLASIGYPPNITLEDYTHKKTKKSNNSLIFKIGITGFCFGNVMLLSFPEYFGIGDQHANFRTAFNYLNLLFSIPVLIYGAKDYIVSAYKSVKIRKINIDVPITIGIFALYLRSLYEVVLVDGAGYFDSFIGLIFFLLVGKWFQQKTYGAINFERDYKSYFPIAVTKMENKEECVIPLEKVEIGDVLRIKNNELIPADSTLISENGSIDYSFVTGESTPIEKESGEKLYAGGRQSGMSIEIEITKKIENSYLTQLWNNPIFDKQISKETITDRISKRFTVFLILIAGLAGVFWYFKDPSQAAFVMVSILIVACPCAIALSVPFTYGNGIRVLGKKEMYLRASNVVEPMAEVTDIVFDKTGTITQNDLHSIQWEGIPLNKMEQSIIQKLTANSIHPLSRQISNYLPEKFIGEVVNFQEYSGKGIEADVDRVTYKIGNKTWIGVTFEDHKTRVCISINNVYRGAFLIENSYRIGLENMLAALHQKHYCLHVLSGDNTAELEKLKNIFPQNTIFNFNQKPEDKLNYIKELQKEDKKIMMLGDGLNDSGAIQQADVGVSVVSDVYAFTPSSDIILNGEKLRNLLDYILFSKYNITVVKLSYVFSFMYNFIGLSFAVTGNLEPLVAAILMPLSSISVVVLVTILINLRARKLK